MKAKITQKTSSLIMLVAKLLVIVIVAVMIYFKLEEQEDLIGQMTALVSKAMNSSKHLFIVVILLMPFNWLLETLKWKLLSGKLQPITMLQALKGVLRGITLGFITPHAVGDYFGRILSSGNDNRLRLVGAIMLGRISQMIATGVFGLFGIYYLLGAKPMLLALLIATLLMLLFIFLFNNKWLIRLTKKYLSIIAEYSVNQLILLQGLSMARYLVFCFQFLLILKAFLPTLDYILASAGVTWIFLAKSLLPSFNFLSDLGIREYSAIYFFEQYHVEILPVVCASLFIWVINILVPTLVGLPLVLQLKWNRK